MHAATVNMVKVLQGFLLIPLNVFLVSFNSFPLVAAGVYFSFSNVNEKLPLSKQVIYKARHIIVSLKLFHFKFFAFMVFSGNLNAMEFHDLSEI